MNETLSTILIIFFSVLICFIVLSSLLVWKLISDLRSLISVIKNSADILTHDASTFTSKIHEKATKHKNYSGIMSVVGIAYPLIRWYITRKK